MRRKFWLLAAVCLLVCLLAGCGSKEQTVDAASIMRLMERSSASRSSWRFSVSGMTTGE